VSIFEVYFFPLFTKIVSARIYWRLWAPGENTYTNLVSEPAFPISSWPSRSLTRMKYWRLTKPEKGTGRDVNSAVTGKIRNNLTTQSPPRPKSDARTLTTVSRHFRRITQIPEVGRERVAGLRGMLLTSQPNLKINQSECYQECDQKGLVCK
jgi:hypothetical protein